MARNVDENLDNPSERCIIAIQQQIHKLLSQVRRRNKKKTRNTVFVIKRMSTDHMGELDPDKKVKFVCEWVFVFNDWKVNMHYRVVSPSYTEWRNRDGDRNYSH